MKRLFEITSDLFGDGIVNFDEAQSLAEPYQNDDWDYEIEETSGELRLYAYKNEGADEDSEYAPNSEFTMVTNEYGYIVIGEEVELTEAEAEIMDVLKDDPTASNAIIANRLGKSENTIRNQISSIYERYGVDSERGEMARLRLYELIGWLNTNTEPEPYPRGRKHVKQ